MKPQPCGIAESILCGVALLVLTGCPTPAPKISPPAGPYTCPQSVTITDVLPNATIFYSADGSTPTASSTKYSGPFALNTSATVRAIALGPGAEVSSAASVVYVCKSTVLTRGEFAVLLQRQFSLPQPAHPLNFPDLQPSNAVYSAAQAAAPYMNAQVLCPGCYLNTNFAPDEPVSRAISTLAIVRVLAATHKIELLSTAESESVLANVSDAKILPAGARPYFATAIRTGIVKLQPDNSFQFGQKYIPAEMSTTLENVHRQFGIGVAPR